MLCRSSLVGSLVALLWVSEAGAQAPAEPRSRTGAYSRYEEESIRLVLAGRKAELDPAPEGKRIEGIDVVTLDVIEERDPAPRLLNALHVTSREYVIRREVLVREGELYRKVLVDETARNLRQLPQLSLVLCFAARGSSPDAVRLVVVTKDVWSLRMSWDVALSSGGLEQLVLVPTETNIAGRQQTLGGRLEVLPASYSGGLFYSVPRVVGSRVAASASGNVIFNRASGRPEGSFGSVVVDRPLFSTRTEWALRASGTWRYEVTRRYVNAAVGTFDARSTEARDGMPFLYRSRRATAQVAFTRSYGWASKLDMSEGVELVKRQFSVPDAGQFDPRAVSEFIATKVPTSDDRFSPFVSMRAYTTHFLRTFDLDSLALQEDVRLGHDVSLKVYPSLASSGSTRSLLGATASAWYTAALWDGYARLGVTSNTEREPSRLADASIQIDARIASPRASWGRVIVDGTLLNRYRNYLNRTSFLGGDSRLRGYPTSYLVGKDLIAYNVELRTRPVQVFSCQLGGALFYDSGDAFDGFSSLALRSSAGAGFRVLFPQLDRVVFRGDVGFPFSPPPGELPFSFFVSFLQAFGQ